MRRRIRRHDFTMLTVLSLLLCVATVGMWVRSYWRYDEYSWNQRSRDRTTGSNVAVGAVSNRGRLATYYQWYTQRVTLPRDWPTDGTTSRAHAWRTQTASASAAHFGHFGFYIGAIMRADLTSRVFHVPHWFVCVATASLPAWAVIRRWRNRLIPGTCLACGYDLRATPDRCPECGTVAAGSSSQPRKPLPDLSSTLR